MRSLRSKRKARKRLRQKKRELRRALRQKVRDRLDKNEVVIVETAGGVKMSEVLRAFVRPYMGFADTEEGFRKLIVMAAVAWNVSLLPKGEREALVEKVLEALPEEVRDDGRLIIEELMKRKERYFPEYRRMIVDFEVADAGDMYYLTVISTIQDE